MGKIDPTPWLLEEDDGNPSIRYLALRDLLKRDETDSDVTRARSDLMMAGPVPAILEAQEPEGYWVKEGAGYSPKYRSTVWSLLLLAELGADPGDARVRLGCEYLLDHSTSDDGAFSVYQKARPSGALHCLNGNMIFAMEHLGFGQDERVLEAVAWQARAILGEEPMTYYASGTSAPGFACGVNEGQSCAWGANKAIRGLLQIPPEARDSIVERALDAGAEFLLSRDPAVADYPYTGRVSSTWFRLGFALSYWSDVLETLANLVDLGYGQDSRLDAAFEWLLGKQDELGRWELENSLNGKTWIDIESKGEPSKWITLRAMKVLTRAGRLDLAIGQGAAER